MVNFSARIALPARQFPLLALICGLVMAGHVAATGVDVVGVPWTGEAGVSESVATINARSDQKAKQGKPAARIRQRPRPDRRGMPHNPQSNEPPIVAYGPLTPNGPQAMGTNFIGPMLTDTRSYPPDSMGAVGPSQFIVAVNGCLRSYNKSTGIADNYLNAAPNAFWVSVMTPPSSTTSTTDPRIRYDRLSARWFITMVDTPYNTATANRVMIAVSSGSTITSTSSFTFFQFQNTAMLPAGGTAGDFADYPTLGIDNNALYIGVDVFSSTSNYKGTTGFVVRKSSILGSGPIVVTAFRGLAGASSEGPASPQGVDNYDPAATQGYFIGSSNIGYGYLVLRRISTPGGTPTISPNILITVPSTEYPMTVPHKGNTKGTNGNLDAVSDRLFAAHLRNGRLWTAHNIEVNDSGVATNGGGRNGSRWYEIQNLSTTPSLVQSGTVFDSTVTSPKSYWIPSLMVSGQGHVAMGFSSAGAANYINAGTCGRLATDALGTMQTPVDYTTSSTAYNPTGDTGGSGGRRWGDYSYTSLDPNDDMTMWTIQQYCNSANSYALRIAKLIAPPPATPASCNPASLTTGLTNVSVTLTGTQVSGSGFYDPGSGFPNRLAAAVSGGVVINSVTYNSATSVTLNLNTASASPGAQTITLTNPDGQTLTSAAGILTLALPLTPIQNWRQLHFATTLNSGTAADTADPNDNGIVNLTEYALAGDPLGTTTGTTILPYAGRSADNHLQILFTRYTDRTDLILTVQATDSLTGLWTDLAQSSSGEAFISLVSDATATETGTDTARGVTVTDIYQVTDVSSPRRFMRLKIANTD
ncbi:MAG: hypothetical protein WCP35_03335 [Verrucomicrobiota bacterium]